VYVAFNFVFDQVYVAFNCTCASNDMMHLVKKV